jgi:hypothetical protein
MNIIWLAFIEDGNCICDAPAVQHPALFFFLTMRRVQSAQRVRKMENFSNKQMDDPGIKRYK